MISAIAVPQQEAYIECPGGVEEMKCSERQSCAGQFRCYETIICLNIGSLCDSVRDCIYGDDEFFCLQNTYYCPSGCRCLFPGHTSK